MKKQPTPPAITLPPLTLDARLNKRPGEVLFPEKLKRAQETLARVGLPAEWVEEATAAAAKADALAGTKAKPAVKSVSALPRKAA